MSPDQVVFVVENEEANRRAFDSWFGIGFGAWSHPTRSGEGGGAIYYHKLRRITQDDGYGLHFWRHDHEPWR